MPTETSLVWLLALVLAGRTAVRPYAIIRPYAITKNKISEKTYRPDPVWQIP